MILYYLSEALTFDAVGGTQPRSGNLPIDVTGSASDAHASLQGCVSKTLSSHVWSFFKRRRLI